jgi:hypothetical protein
MSEKDRGIAGYLGRGTRPGGRKEEKKGQEG